MKPMRSSMRSLVLAAVPFIGWTATCPAAAEPPPPKTSETMKDLDKRVRRLFDGYMRDPSICAGPDGKYYLTGTTEGQNSIRIWESKDLKEWKRLEFSWT